MSDLVWDESLEIKVSDEEFENFLGANKYQPILDNIYKGLGISQEMLDAAKGLTPPSPAKKVQPNDGSPIDRKTSDL